jgi:hypothetical protein
MKKLLLLFIVILYCSGATYYVSNDGNDSSDGLSNSSSWATINKINTFSSSPGFSPGDTIVLADDSVWRETLRCFSAGTLAQPIIYTRSNTGNRPIIRGSDLVPVNNWTAEGQNWYWQPPANGAGGTYIEPGQVWENEVRLTWKNSVVNITGNGQFAWNSTSNRVYIRPTDGSLDNETLEVAQRCSGIWTSYYWSGLNAKQFNHDIIIDGLQVEKVAGRGDSLANPYTDSYAALMYSIMTSGGYNITIRNCVIKQMGGGAKWVELTNGTNWSDAIEFWKTYNCKSYNNTVYDGHCGGIDHEFQQDGNQTTYEESYNNNISNIDGFGLQFLYTNGSVYGNTIKNSGKNYPNVPGCSAGIIMAGLNSTQTVSIYNNYVGDTTTAIKISGVTDPQLCTIQNNTVYRYSIKGISAESSTIIEIGNHQFPSLSAPDGVEYYMGYIQNGTIR